MFLFFSVFFICIIVFFRFLSRLLDYWKNKNIPFVATDVWAEIKSKFYDPVPLLDRYRIIYNKFAGHPFGGCFQQFKPQLLIRDPDLIRRILSTDFDYFRDRGHLRFCKNDPLSNNIFAAPGYLWKKLRIRLTPTFTSGKMKYMFDLVNECAEEFQQSLQQSALMGEVVDIKDCAVNYTLEVISSTAFGLKPDSMTSESEFKRITREIFPNRLDIKIRFILHDWFPFLQEYFHVSVFSRKVNNFFMRLVKDTVSYRRENNVRRNDFLQILMSLNESSSRKSNDTYDRKPEDEQLEFTDDLMASQCFVFFVAGFDTSSLIVSSALLELAVHPHIQRTLHNEVDDFMEKYDNKITYEMIHEMPYLHKVVQETMRKYPVLHAISRMSIKDYHIPDSDSIIDKGTEVVISIAGLHYNQEYFPNPETFDPERFTDEEINARHKFVYLPFGGGPRACIGARFGLLSVKLALVYLLQKYHFNTTSKTVYPVRFKPFRGVTDYDHKLLLSCSLRNL